MQVLYQIIHMHIIHILITLQTETKDNHKNKRKKAKTGKKKSRKNEKEEDTTAATSEPIKFNESIDKDRIDVENAFDNDIGIITSESNVVKNDIETVPGLSQSSYERGPPTSNTLYYFYFHHIVYSLLYTLQT